METGVILGLILLVGLAIIGWKFVVGNNQHNIATTIISGANKGLDQVVPELKKADVKKNLAPNAEFITHLFFQSLGIAQFNDSSNILKLKPIQTQASAAIEAQVSQSLLRQFPVKENIDHQLTTSIANIANKFTAEMREIQTHQKDNVESCATPIVKDIADQLGSLIFTNDTYAIYKAQFQAAMSNALDATCSNIYQKLSGKGETGRYLGGGCC